MAVLPGHVDGSRRDLARQVHHDEEQSLQEVELVHVHPPAIILSKLNVPPRDKVRSIHAPHVHPLEEELDGDAAAQLSVPGPLIAEVAHAVRQVLHERQPARPLLAPQDVGRRVQDEDLVIQSKIIS